jgi:hypothetical protein
VALALAATVAVANPTTCRSSVPCVGVGFILWIVHLSSYLSIYLSFQLQQ